MIYPGSQTASGPGNHQKADDLAPHGQTIRFSGFLDLETTKKRMIWLPGKVGCWYHDMFFLTMRGFFSQ